LTKIPLVVLRKKRGLTQKELATILGIANSTVCQYEKGRRCPSLKTAKRIANIFNVSVETVIFTKGD